MELIQIQNRLNRIARALFLSGFAMVTFVACGEYHVSHTPHQATQISRSIVEVSDPGISSFSARMAGLSVGHHASRRQPTPQFDPDRPELTQRLANAARSGRAGAHSTQNWKRSDP
ncbi:MAG: hypothetical protein NDI61_07315 [Bdellovibrionaceae bacterium]|nr:hypothetical protein [Pseudobdellovibrionaceae bacterium]